MRSPLPPPPRPARTAGCQAVSANPRSLAWGLDIRCTRPPDRAPDHPMPAALNFPGTSASRLQRPIFSPKHPIWALFPRRRCPGSHPNVSSDAWETRSNWESGAVPTGTVNLNQPCMAFGGNVPYYASPLELRMQASFGTSKQFSMDRAGIGGVQPPYHAACDPTHRRRSLHSHVSVDL